MGRPRVVKKYARAVDRNQGKLGGDGTDYDATYIQHKDFVPVKTLKPPPTPPKPRDQPMQTETTTMKSFVPKNLNAKRDMIIPVEKHEVSDEPLSSVTVYRNDYIPKKAFPPILLRPKTNAEEHSSANIKFDSRTTNKQSFKTWKPQRITRYGELPTYMVPLIYPNKKELSGQKNLYQSSTHSDFPYKTIPKPEQVKVVEGNIKVGEGDRELETTNQAVYKFLDGEGRPAASMRPSRIAKMLAMRKMEITSKYQADFPKREEYPLPPKPKTPAPATLEIKMNNDRSFDTEQRKQYHGWDVKVHKRPGLSKLEDNTQLSADAMQTNTTMTSDFTPKEIAVIRVKAQDRPRTNMNETRGKFQDATTNRSFYKDWGVGRRMRFGDFHEAYKQMNLPDKVKPAYELSTTTKSTFVEKHGRPRTSMRPPFTTIDRSQLHDFNTVAKSCYTYPPASAYEIEDFEIKC